MSVSSGSSDGGWTYEAALKVVWCEEGGTAQWDAGNYWFWSGPSYPNSMGISADFWSKHGGGSDVSAAAQIAVASQVQASPPDQGAVVGVSRAGCGAW